MGRGGNDRVLMLPQRLVPFLCEQLTRAHALWSQDQAEGRVGMEMPNALAGKYPCAGASYQMVLGLSPSNPFPRSAQRRRATAPHVRPFDQTFQRAFNRAVLQSRIDKPATSRHAFATRLPQAGYDIRTVQDLLGHAGVATKMIYTHALRPGGGAVRSPIDPIGFD
jgi:integrase